MKLRPPSIPLITVDPYFSVWMPADRLTDQDSCHWTGKPNPIRGILMVDGTAYRFLGQGVAPAMEQVSLEIGALTTTVRLEAAGVALTISFMTPLLPEDYEYLTRPVSYMKLSVIPLDGQKHHVSAVVSASEELCLDEKGEMAVVTAEAIAREGISVMRMGSQEQPVLKKAGDDIRIDWGYFYLAVENGTVAAETGGEGTRLIAWADLDCGEALFCMAYDDVESIEYFGAHL